MNGKDLDDGGSDRHEILFRGRMEERTMVLNKLTNEERDVLYEKYKDYFSKPGEGANLFDDWNEMAPGFLDQCTVPERKIKKNS